MQGRTQQGERGATAPPPEKTIFTIFRMSLLSILWIFATFFGIHIGLTAPPPHSEKILRTALFTCVTQLSLSITFLHSKKIQAFSCPMIPFYHYSL
jgi:hypothetical protein